MQVLKTVVNLWERVYPRRGPPRQHIAQASVQSPRLSWHLHLDQCRLKQSPQRLKLMHRGHHQDRRRGFGLQQQGLMHHGRRAQCVVGGLDQGVFEGMGDMGWIGDNFQHDSLLSFLFGYIRPLSNGWVAAMRGLTDRWKERKTGARERAHTHSRH
ncbi:protein of unknown function [Pseudomonas inefficax]|uniref:Uncharacterized protein n=1 Tax=Pseudomonas inefficax TaxID=2078786 RepID=A0AAQ1PDS1_9PSED|nr:protein of unknown function [Pseudomonas inefficax]